MLTFRVYIPGKSSLSGYIDPESEDFPGLYTRKVNFAKKCLKLIFLNSCKTVKTQFLFKKRPWLVSKSLLVWILSKKSWGHLRITFSLSGSIYPESENSFANISAKMRKKSKLYFWSYLRSYGVPIYEKNQRSKISRYYPFNHMILLRAYCPRQTYIPKIN